MEPMIAAPLLVLILLFVLLMVGGLILLLVIRGRSRGTATVAGSPASGSAAGALDALPYRKRDSLLTKAERSFFGVLQEAAAEQLLVFSKVRLADLLWMPKGTPVSYLNRIQAKHVDFVLCDPETVSPRLVIELDDSSHQRPDRQARDQMVDEALKAAGLPILRVPARYAYSTQELASDIQAAVQ
jgi:hypothetical protein